METIGSNKKHLQTTFRILFSIASLVGTPILLSGCLVAGGSRGGGFFIWPGSLGLLFVIALLFFFLRRGR